jgi:hypothetical protein
MRAVVKKVEVHAVPFTPDDGEHWDLMSGPDLYYEAYGPDETLLHTSDVAPDVRPNDLPVALDGGFAVEITGQSVFRLLDSDLTTDELVARIAFVPGRLIEEGRLEEPPRAVRLVNGDTSLRLTLAWP